jgi:predicted small lipoprotein YifL
MRFCWAQYAFWAVIIALGVMSMLSGCGAKGDLYLPPEQKQTTPAQPTQQSTTSNSNQTE